MSDKQQQLGEKILVSTSIKSKAEALKVIEKYAGVRASVMPNTDLLQEVDTGADELINKQEDITSEDLTRFSDQLDRTLENFERYKKIDSTNKDYNSLMLGFDPETTVQNLENNGTFSPPDLANQYKFFFSENEFLKPYAETFDLNKFVKLTLQRGLSALEITSFVARIDFSKISEIGSKTIEQFVCTRVFDYLDYSKDAQDAKGMLGKMGIEKLGVLDIIYSFDYLSELGISQDEMYVLLEKAAVRVKPLANNLTASEIRMMLCTYCEYIKDGKENLMDFDALIEKKYSDSRRSLLNSVNQSRSKILNYQNVIFSANEKIKQLDEKITLANNKEKKELLKEKEQVEVSVKQNEYEVSREQYLINISKTAIISLDAKKSVAFEAVYYLDQEKNDLSNAEAEINKIFELSSSDSLNKYVEEMGFGEFAETSNLSNAEIDLQLSMNFMMNKKVEFDNFLLYKKLQNAEFLSTEEKEKLANDCIMNVTNLQQIRLTVERKINKEKEFFLAYKDTDMSQLDEDSQTTLLVKFNNYRSLLKEYATISNQISSNLNNIEVLFKPVRDDSTNNHNVFGYNAPDNHWEKMSNDQRILCFVDKDFLAANKFFVFKFGKSSPGANFVSPSEAANIVGQDSLAFANDFDNLSNSLGYGKEKYPPSEVLYSPLDSAMIENMLPMFRKANDLQDSVTQKLSKHQSTIEGSQSKIEKAMNELGIEDVFDPVFEASPLFDMKGFDETKAAFDKAYDAVDRMCDDYMNIRTQLSNNRDEVKILLKDEKFLKKFPESMRGKIIEQLNGLLDLYNNLLTDQNSPFSAYAVVDLSNEKSIASIRKGMSEGRSEYMSGAGHRGIMVFIEMAATVLTAGLASWAVGALKVASWGFAARNTFYAAQFAFELGGSMALAYGGMAATDKIAGTNFDETMMKNYWSKENIGTAAAVSVLTMGLMHGVGKVGKSFRAAKSAKAAKAGAETTEAASKTASKTVSKSAVKAPKGAAVERPVAPDGYKPSDISDPSKVPADAQFKAPDVDGLAPKKVKKVQQKFLDESNARKAEFAGAQKANEAHINKQKASDAEITRLESEKDALIQSQKRLEDDLIDPTKDAAHLDNLKRNQIPEVQRRIAKKEAEILKAKENRLNIDREIAANEKKMNDLLLEQRRAEFETLKDRRLTLETDIKKLNKNVELNQKEIRKYNKEIADLSKKKAKLNYAAVKSEYDALLPDVTASPGKVIDPKKLKKFNELEDQLSSIQQIDDRISDLNKGVVTRTDTIKKLKTTIDRKKILVESSNTKISNAQNDIIQIESSSKSAGKNADEIDAFSQKKAEYDAAEAARQAEAQKSGTVVPENAPKKSMDEQRLDLEREKLAFERQKHADSVKTGNTLMDYAAKLLNKNLLFRSKTGKYVLGGTLAAIGLAGFLVYDKVTPASKEEKKEQEKKIKGTAEAQRESAAGSSGLTAAELPPFQPDSLSNPAAVKNTPADSPVKSPSGSPTQISDKKPSKVTKVN